jgi:hypothetical protein
MTIEYLQLVDRAQPDQLIEEAQRSDRRPLNCCTIDEESAETVPDEDQWST